MGCAAVELSHRWPLCHSCGFGVIILVWRGAEAWNKEAENAWTLDSVPFVLTFAVATGVLVLASFWQAGLFYILFVEISHGKEVRTSHAMLLIVNSWSAAVLRGGAGGCMRSKLEWKRRSAE